MSDDKICKWDYAGVATAADLAFVHFDIEVVPTSAVPRTITSIFVNMEVQADTNTGVYNAILYVTDTDGVVPDFGTTKAGINTAMENYKGNIWCTQAGYVFKPVSGVASPEAKIVMEPGTARRLKPGQKVVLIFLAANQLTSTVNTVYYCADWNVWLNYS